MPAFPELGDGAGGIRTIEIEHEAKTEDAGAAAGDVGVAGEVAVDLEGEEDGGDPVRDAREVGGVVEDHVHSRGQCVGNDHFFEEAPEHKTEPVADAGEIDGVLLTELMQQILRPLDGTGDQLGEEHDIEGVDAEVPLGLLYPPIHLDGVTHRLEGVEGETDGKDDGKCLDRVVPVEELRQSVQICAEEVEILEESKKTDISDDGEDKEPLSPLSLALGDVDTGKIVDDDGRGQDENIGRYEGHVKDATGEEEECPSDTVGEKKIQRRDDGEKDEELEGVEKHVLVRSAMRRYCFSNCATNRSFKLEPKSAAPI